VDFTIVLELVASVILAAIVIQTLGNENKWINLLSMVPVLLPIGEITPETLAIRNNIAFARSPSSAPPCRLSRKSGYLGSAPQSAEMARPSSGSGTELSICLAGANFRQG